MKNIKSIILIAILIPFSSIAKHKSLLSKAKHKASHATHQTTQVVTHPTATTNQATAAAAAAQLQKQKQAAAVQAQNQKNAQQKAAINTAMETINVPFYKDLYAFVTTLYNIYLKQMKTLLSAVQNAQDIYAAAKATKQAYEDTQAAIEASDAASDNPDDPALALAATQANAKAAKSAIAAKTATNEAVANDSSYSPTSTSDYSLEQIQAIQSQLAGIQAEIPALKANIKATKSKLEAEYNKALYLKNHAPEATFDKNANDYNVFQGKIAYGYDPTVYTDYINQVHSLVSYDNQFATIILILRVTTQVSQICMQAATVAPGITVLPNIPTSNFKWVTDAKNLNIYDNQNQSINSIFSAYQKGMKTQTTLNGQLDQCLTFMTKAKSKISSSNR